MDHRPLKRFEKLTHLGRGRRLRPLAADLLKWEFGIRATALRQAAESINIVFLGKAGGKRRIVLRLTPPTHFHGRRDVASEMAWLRSSRADSPRAGRRATSSGTGGWPPGFTAQGVASSRRRVSASGRRRPIHNDLHPWNALVDRQRICAIDFENMLLGFPVQDIGTTLHHLRGYLPDDVPNDERVAAYRRVTGPWRRGRRSTRASSA
jgi:Ser/Thr protein kinase RdoA (MazF antagonist)